MASSFLKRKAQQQAQKIDEQFGSSAYGGSGSLNNSNPPKNTASSSRNASSVSGAPAAEFTKDEQSVRASSFLANKARVRAQEVDEQFGEDSYGGSNWLNRKVNENEKEPEDKRFDPASLNVFLNRRRYTPTLEDLARQMKIAKSTGQNLPVENTDPLAAYEKPEAYTAENFQNYRERAQALADLNTWTDEQRAEAEQLYDLLRVKGLANGGNLADMWSDTMYSITKNEDKYEPLLSRRVSPGGDLYDDWGKIVERLAYKTQPGRTALGAGLIQGSGALSLTEGIYNLLGKAGVSDEYIKPGLDSLQQLKEIGAYGQQEAPVAYAAGNIGGSLALLTSLATGIGEIAGFAELPAIAQSVISGAGSMGGMKAIQELGEATSGDISTGKYLGDIAVDSLAGAAGGTLSGVLGNAGVKIITSKGLTNNTIARAATAGLSGSGFAAGNTGAKMLAQKLGYKDGDNISAGQLVQDVLVGFAFGSISYLLRNAGSNFTTKEPEYEWKYFNKDMTADEAKALYRKLAMENHPDRGGSTEAMAEINSEYERFVQTVVNKAAAAYTQAAQAHAAGNDTAAAEAEASFSENMLILQGYVDDGIITGTEAAEAMEVLNSVLSDGITVSPEASGENLAQANTGLSTVTKTAAATSNVQDALVAAGADEKTAQEIAPIISDILSGEEISGNEAAKIAKSGAAVSVLENETGTEINTDAPISEVKTAIKGLASPADASNDAQTGKLSTEQQSAQKGPSEASGNRLYPGEKTGLPFDIVTETIPTQTAAETTPQPLTGKAAVADFAKTLGKAGENVFNQMYGEDQNAVGYIDAMMKAYNIGKNGLVTDSEWQNTVLQGLVGNTGSANAAQLQAAYIAGQADGGRNVSNNKPESIENNASGNYTEGESSGYGPLMRALDGNDNVVMDGMRYTITRTADGYHARIDLAKGSEGYITDARSNAYRSGPFASREEAVEDLLAVARSSFYQDTTLKEDYNEHTGTARDVAERQAVAEVPHGERNEQPSGDRRSNGGLLDEVAAESVQGTSGGQKSGEVLREEGFRNERSDVRSDAERTGGRSGVGDREGRDLSSSGKLTYEEEAALLAYKSGGSYQLNAKLREGAELSDQEKEIVSGLDKALEKLPVRKGTLYRNISFDVFGGEEGRNAFMEQHAEGALVVYPAYTSTSTEADGYDVEGDYVVHMIIEGETGHDLEGYGNNDESEVLFERERAFSVTKVEHAADGTPTIYMTEEVINGENDQSGEGGSASAVGRNAQGAGERNASGSDQPAVQSVHQERENKMQPVSERDTEGYSDEQAELQSNSEEVTVEEETAHEIEVKDDVGNQENPRGNNFVIPAKGLSLPAGEKARFKANVNAIKTLRTIMAEGRFATPSEQEILSKYVGWGGLANAFDDKKADWAKEYKQLKGLMTEEEYKAARGSTLNAHYTDVGVIRGIYAGLEKLGFKGGRLLEPSAGVGHFAGAMPENLIPGVKSWTMVELDPITGNIAKYLYPNADVRVQGFETARIPDNYMDMAISNVPFGKYAILDKTYPNTVTRAIHNYFFAKALDKVRPGGLVTFITSRYTMDAQDSSVRQYIMQRADLLGAIRLPDSAFKGNAGTEVVTDILVLKKREPGTKYSGEAFENTGYYHRDLQIEDQTNEYFQKHPEMVLGEASKNGSMYRGDSLTYKAKDTKSSLQKQIEKAFGKIKGTMDYPVHQTAEEIRREIKQAEGKGKEGSIVKKDGKFYKINEGVLTEADIAAKDAAKMDAVIGMRDAGRSLLDAQINGQSEAEIAALRKELNKLYDDFVKKNGPLNKQANLRIINLDSDSAFIRALENYDKKTGKAEKAAIFSRNTVAKNETVTHTDTVEEGLTVALNETGEVDVKRIAELTGESEKYVTDHLLSSGTVFLDRDGNMVTAEVYLSGNVKAKLRDAEALAEGNPEYQRNVEALKKVIPADIAPEEISVRLGVTWVPDTIYSDFAAEMLGSSNRGYSKAVTVQYTKQTGEFNVTLNQSWLKTRPENLSTWGTPDRPFHKILEATLNNRNVTVWRKTEDGGRVLDKQATAAAQEKQEKILAEFQKWIWADETRKTELAQLYNDVFNNTVTPKYDGSNLTVNGYNVKKPLREHQKNAVQRIINSGGNTLLAHRVGAGKTYEMAAAAMKLRQLGVVKKPMFVVPKSLVAQWGNEFLDFFPAAKVLVAGDNSFSAANRKQFINQIATGDYDAVVLSYEQFKAVPMSVEHQNEFYQQQIDELEEAIRLSAQRNGRRDPSVKQLEKSKKALETKLRKKGDMKKDVDNTDFEALGVDALFVDEAHNFKNLFYTTNMNNVSGLGSKNGTERAFDLYMKVRYLQKLNGGRGIVFATATPVMNSMSEMYIMQKYLQSDLLEAKGLTSFDAWANQFGEVRTVLEMNPSGKGYRQKQSFSRFKNLAELQQMFRSFADVITEIPGLKIPEMKTGKRIVVECEPSEFQLDYIDKLADRADAIKGRRVDPKVDNMLKITSEGRKLSYTQRMIDPSLPYEDDNKVTKCAQNVYDIWKESKGIKGTQLVFCDLSTPKGGAVTETSGAEIDTSAVEAEDISIYDDLKNMLVAQGIPAGEVAFIHDADTADKKAKLFADVNEGRVRVLIGSTGKMGVGMNAQQRMVALHHLDAPWRPGDIEQREGRALRQGNINDEVGIYVYITKQTFDSRMWDNLQRKASFIHQVMAGDLTARESEGDGDFALSAAEIKAIASGNPLIMEQFEVAAELAKLESLERAHNKEVADARSRLNKTMVQLASDEESVKKLESDLAARKDTSGEKFTITIGGQTITERKAAGEALIEQAKKHLKLSAETEQLHKIGKFAGFDLLVNNKGDVLLKGAAQYRATVNMQSAVGTVQSLEALPKRIDNMLASVQKRIEEGNAAIKKLEQIIASPFDRAAELSKARQRNAEIMAELNPSEDTAADMGDEEDETEAEPSGVVKQSRDSGIAAHPEQWTAERIKEGKAESARPLSEIIAQLQHDLGINITYGHVRGKGVRGQFSPDNKGVRSRIEQDMPTISHEIGHWLDDKFGLLEDRLPNGVNAELEKALGPLAELYSKKQIKSEGLAEYVRKFLQNRDTAAIDYPETTKYVLGSLDAKSLAIFEQFADEINAYYALDADTATSSIRFREEGGPDFRTTGEKIADMGDSFYQAWVDSNYAIRRLDKETGGDAYIYATNAAYSDAVASRIITGDLTDSDGKYVAPGLKTALQGVNTRNKKEWRDFGEYLVMRHGPERLEAGKRVFADDRKNNAAWMERRRMELEQQYPAFKDAGTRLIAFEKALTQTWGVNTGLISQELFDSWNEKYESHVPLNRAIPKERGRYAGAKKGYANQNNPLKRAKGSGLDIIHPAENIISEIVTLVNAGMRNNVMLKIADTANKYGADASFMEKVPTPVVPHAFDMTGVKAGLSDRMLEGVAQGAISADSLAGVDAVIDSLNDVLYQYERGKAGGDVVTVLRDGTPEFWKINDKSLLESITHLSTPKVSGILEAYAKTTRFMTANITGNNPIWSIFSNAPRDLGTFAVYSKEKNPIKAVKAIGSAYINAFNQAYRDGKNLDPLFAEYLALGGGHASAYSADADLAKKARRAYTSTTARRVMDTVNPVNWISFISDTIEMGPRFATYKLMRLSGADPQTAFYEAMDVTVNFRKAGYQSRQVNKVVPFFNASVQGVDKFARYFSAEDASKEDRAKVAAGRTAAFVGASAVLAALLYALNNGDDEKKKEYQQLSNYTKNSFWCIPLEDGKYFCIPKPRELAVITSLFETSLELWEGGNEHAFDEFYEYAVDNFLPSVVSDLAELPSNIAKDGSWEGLKDTVFGMLGSLGLVGVISYMASNRDFLGKPIESQSLQNLEPRDRYNQSTSKIAKYVGQALNWSPQMIDYFGNQVLGYVWKVPRALFPVGDNMRDYTLGVKNTYVKDNVYSQDLVNWLFDKADASKLTKNSDKGNMDKAIAAKNDSSMTTFYSRFNSLNKGNETATSQRTARQTVLDMIYEYRKSEDAGSETRAQKLVYDVIRKAGETELMPSVMNTYIKNDEKRYDLSDSQYVEYQTIYNGYYWSLAEESLSGKHTDRENRALLRQAKELAKQKADEKMLKRIGVQFDSYTEKYPGVSDSDIMYFNAVKDQNGNGRTTQDEAIAVLEIMVENGLSAEDAYVLFQSVDKKWKDNNNPWKYYKP